jgi:hypothetical protein
MFPQELQCSVPPRLAMRTGGTPTCGRDVPLDQLAGANRASAKRRVHLPEIAPNPLLHETAWPAHPLGPPGRTRQAGYRRQTALLAKTDDPNAKQLSAVDEHVQAIVDAGSNPQPADEVGESAVQGFAPGLTYSIE